MSIFSRNEKIIIFLLACIQFCNIVDFMIMMPLGPMLMRIFDITPSEFGLLVSSYTFSAGISGLLASTVIDRFDRKKTLLTFLVGFAFGTILCAIVRNYHLLLFARALTGFFGGVIASIVYSAASDFFEPARRGSAMGAIMTAFSLASIFGVPLSLVIANRYDWHSPFMLIGVVALLIAILISNKFPSMKHHLAGTHERPTFTGMVKHLSNDRNQILALMFMSFVMIGQFSIIPYLSPSYVSNAGFPEGQLPLIYLTGGIVSFFSSPFFGRLSDKIGKIKVFTIGATLSLVPILLISNLSQSHIIYLYILNVSFFFVMSGRMTPAMAIITLTTTPRFRASFLSISSSVQSISNGIATYMAAAIVAKGANNEIMNLPKVGYIAVLFSVLSIIVANKLKIQES